MTELGESKPNVIVIGAGIVGLSTALSLQMRGQRTLVIDREGPAAGASRGNAGAFAFSDIIPLASPGVFRHAPAWLMDPSGPLTIPPAYAFRILPWLLRFSRASRPSEMARGVAAQSALMNHSKKALLDFLKDAGLGDMLRREGNLQVYESDREFEASLPHWRARENQLIPFRHIEGVDAIADVQPGLSSRFTRATFSPEWYSVDDPLDYTLHVAEKFQDRGGKFAVAEATSVTADHETASIRCADGRVLVADKVVVCAGAWSRPLARSLGDRIPLETERGYNTTLPPDALDLRMQITFGGHGFVVTRLSSGIRVGGAVELGGLELPANMRRADILLNKAKDFLPGLRIGDGVQWMGFRPSLPDSLPVIGMARGTNRVIYGFGHGHLGLTQSAGTASLITELALGEPASIDLTPFRADRF
ncbi:MAG: D-amino-acid dehydrogenase [Rhizobiaceae bacterium MnEN-MB40S]|nr:MAG: D-amino-acid dehydrogenase [Rhizobiaceae bacterium MnEN-MB40S]